MRHFLHVVSNKNNELVYWYTDVSYTGYIGKVFHLFNLIETE